MDKVMDTDERIEKILKKLLNPNTKIKNGVNLSCLLSHITKRHEKCELNMNDSLYDTVSCWIIQATNEWECSTKKLSPEILSFALNLAGFISKDESIFMKLNSRNVYERFLAITDFNSAPEVIKIGVISLISSFLEHKSGLHWAIATNYSTRIISCLNATVHNITKEGGQFIADLLDRTINLNETFCRTIIKALTDPLDNNLHGNIGDVEVGKNPYITGTVIPVLKVIAEVLQRLLERTNTAVADIFVKDFKLVCKVKNLLSVSQTEDFEFQLRKIIYLVAFIDMYSFYSGLEIVVYTYSPDPMDTEMIDTVKALIAKGYVRSVLELCYISLICWKSIEHRMPKYFEKDRQIEVDIQYMFIQVIPAALVGAILFGISKIQQILNEDAVRDDYVSKIVKNTASDIYSILFQWRNFLLQDPNIYDHMRLGLRYTLKSKSFYSRNAGVMAFRTLTYSLQDITNHFKENPPITQLPPAEMNYLELLLETIGVFIEEFNITWKDSFESMSIMTLVVELLHFDIWTTKMVVKALNLLNITISQYMPPSMALLVDLAHDSSLKSAGTLLYRKCQDPCWEVKNRSLEVLCTMSYNAHDRFPLLQKIILDLELPHLVVKLANSDNEPCVRGSAVRCLQEMTQVPDFWENLLKIENLQNQFLDILTKETDGMVRKEAATLVSKIYDNNNYHESLLPKVYDIMANAVTGDLHWEVRVTALHFWDNVINRHLQYQGMIDGTFPEVTFSKEDHKIVFLNDFEVKNRLEKVLRQLSKIGCLALLVSAIQDEFNIEVVKLATQIAEKFVERLKRYNITEQSLSPNQSGPIILSNISLTPNFVMTNNSKMVPRTNEHPVLMQPGSLYSLISDDTDDFSSHCHSEMVCNDYTLSPLPSDVTDEIIHDILNSNVNDPLKSLDDHSNNVPSKPVSMCKKSILSPSEFIRYTYSSLELKSKSLKHIDSLDSLLDDMFKEDDIIIDVDSMDCC